MFQMLYDIYDPKTFTQEKRKFAENVVPFVDEDILEWVHKNNRMTYVNEKSINAFNSVSLSF